METMLKYFLLFGFMLFTGMTHAQDSRTVKIKLDNGHTLTGELVEYIMDESVTIRFGNDQVLTFQMDDIDDLEMEDLVVEETYKFREQGLYNRTSLSVLTGESSSGFSVNHSVLYQINRKLGIGVGAGVDNYYKEDGYNIFPVFLELRSYLLPRNKTPFLALRGGYAFAFADEEIGQLEANGGIMVNPSVGYRLSAKDFMMDIFVGIKIQKSDYEYRDFETRIIDEITFKRLDVGIGFMF